MALSDWIQKPEKPATPATHATHEAPKPAYSRPSVATVATVAAISGSQSQGPAVSWDYSAADLSEMDGLIRQLAELEDWSPDELADALDQRRRMAPIRVPEALGQLRESVKRSLAPWPGKPAERSRIVLCRLTA